MNDIKKVMWIDSDWDVFKKLVLNQSFVYFWNNGIDCNVTFINSYDNEEAMQLDKYMMDGFVSVCKNSKKDEITDSQRSFLNVKAKEISKNGNHFNKSSVIPLKEEYSMADVMFRINTQENDVYVLRMDLLSSDREELENGLDKGYLSMELYFYITKVLNKKCVLFTEESVDDVVKKNWMEIYNNYFGDVITLKKKRND